MPGFATWSYISKSLSHNAPRFYLFKVAPESILLALQRFCPSILMMSSFALSLSIHSRQFLSETWRASEGVYWTCRLTVWRLLAGWMLFLMRWLALGMWHLTLWATGLRWGSREHGDSEKVSIVSWMRLSYPGEYSRYLRDLDRRDCKEVTMEGMISWLVYLCSSLVLCYSHNLTLNLTYGKPFHSHGERVVQPLGAIKSIFHAGFWIHQHWTADTLYRSAKVIAAHIYRSQCCST